MFKFRKLTLSVSEEARPLVSDLLLGLDAMGVAEDLEDGEDALISAYFPPEADMGPVMKSLMSYTDFLRENIAGARVGDVTVEDIDRSSWEVWKQVLKTVRAGRRIVITPPWEEHAPKGDEVVIEINPSMAFGTGHHETTRLCIGAMEELIETRRVKSVLDVGCGSGILAISAIKLGAEYAVGLDPDFIAAREAKRNAEKNSVSAKLKLFCGYLESARGKFDMIVANISVEALILMRSELRLKTDESSTFIASGVPHWRRDELVSGFQKAGFVLEREIKDGEWIAVIFGVDSNSRSSRI